MYIRPSKRNSEKSVEQDLEIMERGKLFYPENKP